MHDELEDVERRLKERRVQIEEADNKRIELEQKEKLLEEEKKAVRHPIWLFNNGN